MEPSSMQRLHQPTTSTNCGREYRKTVSRLWNWNTHHDAKMVELPRGLKLFGCVVFIRGQKFTEKKGVTETKSSQIERETQRLSKAGMGTLEGRLHLAWANSINIQVMEGLVDKKIWELQCSLKKWHLQYCSDHQHRSDKSAPLHFRCSPLQNDRLI